MADDASTNSGSVPDPAPEVRDEGPGGTDLSFSEDSPNDGDGESTGRVPHPPRPGSGEDRSSSE